MALRLRHRGPDAQGFFQEGAVSLGHRRLSIIDLAGGNQPMADATGRFVTAYNGEIYNHVELREELTGLGRAFGTKCDTEVLLNAYAEWGADCLQRLSGMFSFAIHDRAERRLFLAVDRFGKKPLYYAQRPGLFVFASEPGSLLAHPGLPARIDPAAVYKYLIHDFVPAPSSIYAGVAKLEGGHCLLLDADAPGPVSPRQYWDLRFQPKSRLSFAQATERFRELFSKAVRARLMSDVPLGVYLSGGLDSSCVLAEVVSAAPAVMFYVWALRPLGRLGFLVEVQPAEWPQRVRQALQGYYWIEERMMVHARHLRQGQVINTHEALNEIVISRGQKIGRAHV